MNAERQRIVAIVEGFELESVPLTILRNDNDFPVAEGTTLAPAVGANYVSKGLNARDIEPLIEGNGWHDMTEIRLPIVEVAWMFAYKSNDRTILSSVFEHSPERGRKRVPVALLEILRRGNGGRQIATLLREFFVEEGKASSGEICLGFHLVVGGRRRCHVVIPQQHLVVPGQQIVSDFVRFQTIGASASAPIRRSGFCDRREDRAPVNRICEWHPREASGASEAVSRRA